MKNIYILFLVISVSSKLSAEKNCYIAISSNDCRSCLVVIPKINKISPKLNPKIILNIDSSEAQFLVRDYFKIEQVPYILDNVKFENLTEKGSISNFEYFTELIIDGKRKMYFPTKNLDQFLDSLNSYADTPDLTPDIGLNKINTIVSKKYFGSLSTRIYGSDFSILSSLNNKICFGNFKSKSANEILINDSILLNEIYKSRLSDTTFLSKVKGYNTMLSENGYLNSNIYFQDHAYSNKNLFVYLSWLNWDSLPSIKSTYETGELKLRFKRYLLKVESINNKYVFHVLKSWETEMEEKMKTELRMQFSCFDSVPVWIYRDVKIDGRKYYYIDLNSNKEFQLNVSNGSEMRKYLLENFFIKDAVLTYDYKLLNNNTKTVLNVYNYNKADDNLRPDIGSITRVGKYNFIIFHPLMDGKTYTRLVIIEAKTNRVVKVNNYNFEINKNFLTNFYYDSSSNLLHIISMDQKKHIYIATSIFVKNSDN